MADNVCDDLKVLQSLNDRAVIDTLPYHEQVYISATYISIIDIFIALVHFLLTIFQITLNAKFQKEQIEKHFDVIKSAFTKLIDERAAFLKEQVDEAEKKSLDKIQAYGEIIEGGNAMLESKTHHGELILMYFQIQVCRVLSCAIYL